MVQKVFNRYEKKFLLNRLQYEAIREKLAVYMNEDEYGLNQIRNIYFDTKDFALIRASIEKPVYKEKFRIRCYGQPDENANYFMEIKKKYKGLVNKRRMVVKAKEMEDILKHPEQMEREDQIAREIIYFLKMYQLEPKLYLAYDRRALYGKEDHDFRVTFDENIRSRKTNLSLEDDTGTNPLLENGWYLMEVKIQNAMPLWFAAILSELEIRSTSFSKYGSVYKKELLFLPDWVEENEPVAISIPDFARAAYR